MDADTLRRIEEARSATHKANARHAREFTDRSAYAAYDIGRDYEKIVLEHADALLAAARRVEKLEAAITFYLSHTAMAEPCPGRKLKENCLAYQRLREALAPEEKDRV